METWFGGPRMCEAYRDEHFEYKYLDRVRLSPAHLFLSSLVFLVF